MATVEERFWAKVDMTGDCWLWTGCLTGSGGYGQFALRHGVRVYAHRFAYELLVGSIPEGMGIDHRHTCPKSCVNPGHLRVTTSKQNNENYGVAPRGASGVRGVFVTPGGRWRVRVRHNRHLINAGTFDTLEEAEAVAIATRNELHTHNDLDRAS